MNLAPFVSTQSSAAKDAKLADRAILVLILIVELWIFTGSFHKYFTHDSLFYLTNVPHSWEQFRQYLFTPSAEKSYRPLNLGLVALLHPFLGLDPRPYHWIPVIFHLLNTALFFSLARRVLASPTAGLAAAAFWGLHSVAGWITYDITYLSDFLLAFLLLVSLLCVLEGVRRDSRLWIAASIAAFVLTLLTKEAATTFPLAVWISLSLADLGAGGEPVTYVRAWRSFKKFIPLTAIYLFIALAFAGLFTYWFMSGAIYSQGSTAAYNIAPLANLLAKMKYLYWALNFPDALTVPNAARNYALAFGLTLGICLIWALDVLRRKGKLTVAEVSGIIWFVGLNIPAFLLSKRMAKWYLYIPLFGLALAFGVLAEHLRRMFPGRIGRIAGTALLGALLVPFCFSSRVQTRSYIAASDSSYQSDLLEYCLNDFRAAHPTLPPQVTIYFLPAFEEGVSELLSAPPIDGGALFSMYYPESRIRAQFAHKGHPLPENIGNRSDVIVLQYLDRYLYDVTSHFASTGTMTLFLLPTFERQKAPLLNKVPAGGRKLYGRYVRLLAADDGARLPEDYYARSEIWILQYLNGRFSDVTDFYKGRHRDGARRLVRSIEGIQYSINHQEIYPDYDRFQTPTGEPVFFPTDEREILTQIGGSTAVVPVGRIPRAARLRFDVSWMFDLGDGAWAEASLRTGSGDEVLFRQRMYADSKMRRLLWQEVTVDLSKYEGVDARLILKCYNDPGGNTVADWLNWREIEIASAPEPASGPDRRSGTHAEK